MVTLRIVLSQVSADLGRAGPVPAPAVWDSAGCDTLPRSFGRVAEWQTLLASGASVLRDDGFCSLRPRLCGSTNCRHEGHELERGRDLCVLWADVPELISGGERDRMNIRVASRSTASEPRHCARRSSMVKWRPFD